jgi:hypothetical protein
MPSFSGPSFGQTLFNSTTLFIYLFIGGNEELLLYIVSSNIFFFLSFKEKRERT